MALTRGSGSAHTMDFLWTLCYVCGFLCLAISMTRCPDRGLWLPAAWLPKSSRLQQFTAVYVVAVTVAGSTDKLGPSDAGSFAQMCVMS